MSQVIPDLKKPTLPSLTNLLDQLKREVMRDINCVKVGVIKDFNADTQEASVEIAFTQVTSTSTAGVKTYASYPLLFNVPVLFPCGGGFTLTFPITAGDECLVLFNDRQLDNWLATGAGSPPSNGRAHDLSDGIAIVGVRNLTRALANISTTSAQLRSDDGETYIDMAPGKIQIVADEVVLHSRTKITFDANGTGFVYTTSQIDTYTNGVTSNNHAPNPPEVPT